jgi:hypothetical protein
MTDSERLAAIEAIRQVKARYFRSVDSADAALASTFLAEDCLLDYRGCCTDPVSGIDHFPEMNAVIEGRAGWLSDAFKASGIVTVHQGHQSEIEITSDTTATGTWMFTDRFFIPPGGRYERFEGYGHYHETYEKIGGEWLLKTTRVTRIKIEVG